MPFETSLLFSTIGARAHELTFYDHPTRRLVVSPTRLDTRLSNLYTRGWGRSLRNDTSFSLPCLFFPPTTGWDWKSDLDATVTGLMNAGLIVRFLILPTGACNRARQVESRSERRSTALV